MTDTDTLRRDLTRVLRPHLPPHLVAPLVEAAVGSAVQTAANHDPPAAASVQDQAELAGAWAWSAALHQLAALAGPYRPAVDLAVLVVPLVSQWWQSRPVEAPGVVVTDTRD